MANSHLILSFGSMFLSSYMKKDGQQFLSRYREIVKNVSHMQAIPFNVKGGHTSMAAVSSIMQVRRITQLVFRSVA